MWFLILICIGLFFGYLINFILKLIFRRMMRQNPHTEYNSHKEGDVVISEDPAKKPKIDPNIGEYIDFEEIDTDKK
jgi:hypothetical protein